MLFSVGTRVKFLHTKDEGVVTALLDNGMVNVLLDKDQIEIPAFIDDLIRSEEYIDQNPSVKAKIVPGKKEKLNRPPDRPPIETQYMILKSLGIQLAFDPIERPDGPIDKYMMYLINDTKYDVLFTFALSLNGQLAHRQNGKLSTISYHVLGEFLRDQLNDSPVFDIECWRVTTQGSEGKLHRSLKIKPKQFFKRLMTAPLLNKQVHLFRIFEKVVPPQKEAQKEDLRSYTKRNMEHGKFWGNIKDRMHGELMEFAEFVPEIDLHIENLVENHEKLSNTQILHIQLQHFEQFLDKAIQLGVKRVFVIHGVGKGRLRDSIATRLIRIQEVQSFKNEFHQKYGFGATEVILE